MINGFERTRLKGSRGCYLYYLFKSVTMRAPRLISIGDRKTERINTEWNIKKDDDNVTTTMCCST